MRILLTLAAAALIALPTCAQQDDQPTDALQQQIEGLIEKLDARKFSDRQKSEQALLRIGHAAIPLMQQAVEDASGEAKLRLQRILTELVRSVRIVEKVPSELLKNVTSVTISSDGKFLYAAAFAANTISVYAIAAETGKLSLVQTITDEKSLMGAVAFRLSPTKPLGIASCYSGRNVTLFSRDESTGKLQQLDVYRGNAQSPPPTFPIEAVFSPNGKFVYVLDCYAKGRNSSGGIMVFRLVDDGRLEWINTFFGQQNCFADIRGIAFHPTRNEMYVCSCEPGTLVRARYNPEAGSISVDQILRDGQNGIEGLSGAFSVVISNDGKFVYTSSGRFGGDSAVSVFTFDERGDLKVVQELISGREKLGGFLGGNELVISPDGRNVYATGTRSSSLAGFSRDQTTGKLTFIETVPFGKRKLGPAGVTISRDGGYVYAAVEGEATIAVFRRDP